MVGVSGGKDSVALTIGLSMLRKYIGFDYEVVAVTLDPQFDHQPMDYSALAELFRQHGIPRGAPHRDRPDGVRVPQGEEPLRPVPSCGGARCTTAQELGCNKGGAGASSGRCRGDAYMNLWREDDRLLLAGDLPSPSGISPSSVPCCFTEYEVQCAVREADLPIVKAAAPPTVLPCGEQTKICAGALPCRPRLPPKTLHALQAALTAGVPSTRARGSFIVQKKKKKKETDRRKQPF